MGIHPNSAALFYHKIRLVIEYHLALEASQLFDGEIELDESYFGGIRKGKRGRGAAGKTAVFGLLKRNGKVYTVIVKDTKTNTLMPIITSKIKPDSVVYTDCYASYNALDVSNFKHFRINHSKEFTDKENKQNHINGIENFWSQAKRVLRKYNGIDKKNFHLFIKECEFRFNNGTPSNQLKVLRKWCGV
ncbi:DDE transposase [Moraxella caviae]|uniref:DDE transposase n=1 Tax=Moraxella caviae TaxID=34060 RepID=A0A1T0AAE5_9GAMM|nr:DDE transposase [Moraxella caviae]